MLNLESGHRVSGGLTGGEMIKLMIGGFLR